MSYIISVDVGMLGHDSLAFFDELTCLFLRRWFRVKKLQRRPAQFASNSHHGIRQHAVLACQVIESISTYTCTIQHG